MIIADYPCAIIDPPIVRDLFVGHMRALAEYDDGKVDRTGFGLQFHERSAAACALALHHMEKCHAV
jgi:hypothetical protein